MEKSDINKKNDDEKILLIGLPYTYNLGDVAIFERTKSVIEKYIEEHGLNNVSVVPIDMTGRIDFDQNPYNDKYQNNLFFRIKRKFFYMFGFKKNYEDIEKKRIYDNTQCICNDAFDENTKSIIFAGGGIVKFKYEYFHYQIDCITKNSEDKSIPVMFSGVGVEGYDGTDKNCMLLKTALNRSCVKYITVRDDLDCLEKNYIDTEKILAKVADPACMISNLYPRKKSDNKIPIIGLGVVRDKLFSDNDIDFNEDEMLNLWSNVFKEIIRRGYKCKLFCNGVKSDYKFAKKLIEYMEMSGREDEILCKRPENLNELIDIIVSFDAIIAGRLHACIIAYSYDVAGIGIVWNNKQLLFGESIGHKERFVTRDNFDKVFIVDALEKAMSESYDVNLRENHCKDTEDYINKFLDEFC